MNMRTWLTLILASSWPLDICTMLPAPPQFEQEVWAKLQNVDADKYMHTTVPSFALQSKPNMAWYRKKIQENKDGRKKEREASKEFGVTNPQAYYDADYDPYVSDNVEERVRGMCDYLSMNSSTFNRNRDIFDTKLPGLTLWDNDRATEKIDYLHQLMVCVIKMRNARYYLGTERPGWIEFLRKYNVLRSEYIARLETLGNEKWPRIEATGSALQAQLSSTQADDRKAFTQNFIDTLAKHALQVSLLHDDVLDIKCRIYSFIEDHTEPVGGRNRLTCFVGIDLDKYKPATDTIGSLRAEEHKLHLKQYSYDHVLKQFMVKIRNTESNQPLDGD